MDNHIEVEEKQQDKGFTLVELLIVIVILGILATVTVFAVRGITDQGKASTCATDKKTLETALETYYAQHGTAAGVPLETALVPLFLHDVSANYDIAQVAVVADPNAVPPVVGVAVGDIVAQPGNQNGCT